MIKQQILQKINNDLSENSKKTYASQLNKFYKVNFPDDEKFDKDKITLSVIKKTLDGLDNINKRKTMLSALLQIVDEKDKEDVRDLMMNEIDAYKVKISKQEKDEDNWITQKEIKKIYSIYKKELNDLLIKKDFNKNELYNIQKLMVIAIMSGLFIQPRRLMDYTEMKIQNIDPKKDNYIDLKNKKFVFNKYKTSSKYGKQEVDIPSNLMKLLKPFIRSKIKNDFDYMFNQLNGKKYESSTMTQYINNIFSKYIDNKISVNSFRHSYLTSKYGNTTDLKQDLKNMATSMAQLETYVKKD
tara:strand:- start:140 stop:1036 length:897 start_codon:yes stop_codon:yes gene_type:complete